MPMKKNWQIAVSPEERFIWFEGEINRQSVRAFARCLIKLNNDGSEPIFFYLTGGGGFIDSYLDMVIAINNSRSKIFCVAHGWVASASFMLTQAVPAGFRLAMAGTKFKFHRAVDIVQSVIPGSQFTQEDYLNDFKELARLDGLELAMFFLKCRPDCRGEITALQQAEKIISVNKAIKLGIIDNYFDKHDFFKDRRIAKALIGRRRNSR